MKAMGERERETKADAQATRDAARTGDWYSTICTEHGGLAHCISTRSVLAADEVQSLIGAASVGSMLLSAGCRAVTAGDDEYACTFDANWTGPATCAKKPDVMLGKATSSRPPGISMVLVTVSAVWRSDGSCRMGYALTLSTQRAHV
jgi:hypothetical protein